MAPHAKRRKLTSAVEEITFDPVARHEFLTGFHKRKLQRTRAAQEYAQKKAREERRLERKKLREERAAEYQRMVEETRRRMEEELNSDTDSGSENNSGEEEEWEGFDEPPPVDYEAEYIDEDKYTTVTVEEMDPSKEALYKTESSGEDGESSAQDEDNAGDRSSAQKEVQKKDKPKKKRKKFRYESKAERLITQQKERLAKRRKAKARRER
ncbi:hypothetical protein VTN77DRAFT_1721 [Rasamsonia byssochlamydoides]|uniref:uncharacterized protein n=1 Tax=Rasamsonia byssochlamydoides TaxID=89139 RepID=UPI003742A091